MLRKNVFALVPLTHGKTSATERSVLMAVVTMDANANLFLHLIRCVAAGSSGRSLQV